MTTITATHMEINVRFAMAMLITPIGLCAHRITQSLYVRAHFTPHGTNNTNKIKAPITTNASFVFSLISHRLFFFLVAF